MIDLDLLYAALPSELQNNRAQLRELSTSALAHAHVSLGPQVPWLVRIPLHSQHGHPPLENLSYQAQCFRELSVSGHAPRLQSVITPRAGLPMGALIVERIDGPLVSLPDDLPLLADAFATIHSLPTSGALPRHNDPLAFLRAEIAQQAVALDSIDLDPDSRSQLDEELAWFKAWTPVGCEPMRCVVTDSHPGNFFVRDGAAIIVDLEKALYGSPMIDLAHATIYTSTTWEAQNASELGDRQVAEFYTRYFGYDPSARAWAVPMRRVLWLRAITWCAHWRAENAKALNAWSDVNANTLGHVAERTAHYLMPEIIARVRRDWSVEGLAGLLG